MCLRGFCQRSGVGVLLAVVVVVGVGFHFQVPALAELGLEANVFEIRRHLVGVVLIVEPVRRIVGIGRHQQEFEACTGVGLKSVGSDGDCGAANGRGGRTTV